MEACCECPSWIKNAAIFDVELGDYYGIGQLPPHDEGMFLLDHASSWANANAAELLAQHDTSTRCTEAGAGWANEFFVVK